MNAADILKYGHLTFISSFEGLSDAACEQSGVCGSWSVKNIVAHLASYEHMLSDVLNSLLNPQAPTPYLKKMGEQGDMAFNDSEVGSRQSLSMEATLKEYTDAYTQNQSLIGQISAETLRTPGTIPWYGTQYAVDDFIVYAFYGHKREHSGQIAIWRDRLS